MRPSRRELERAGEVGLRRHSAPRQNTPTPAGGIGEFNSFSPSKLILEADSADLEWLVPGDSMTDDTGEMAGIIATQLGLKYPRYTVNVIYWNDAGGDYDAPTSIQVGTGTHTFNVYVAAFGGTRSTYMLGSKYAAAIAARNPKLILFVHGLNHVGAGVFANMIRGEFMSATEKMRVTFPSANFAWVAENPKRDDTTMEAITTYTGSGVTINMLQLLQAMSAAQPDITLVDVYSKFIALNKDTGLYSDATHGNTASGKLLYQTAFLEKWAATAPGAFTPGLPFFSTVDGSPLAANGLLTGGPPPTSWTAQNSVVIEAELSIIAPGASRSIKLTSGASGAPNMRQIITGAGLTAAIANGYITVGTLMYRPAGSAATVGRPNVFVAGAAQTGVSLRNDTEGHGDWWWRIQPDIPIGAGATSISILTYADTAGAGMDVDHPTYVDRIAVVAGRNPKNI